MNKQTLDGMWDHLRQIHGVSLRAVETIPDDKLDSRPVANMRTTKELVVHLYTYIKTVPAAILKGALTEDAIQDVSSKISNKKELLQFCRDAFQHANEDYQKITDAQLGKDVDTPFGKSMPGFVLLQVVYDEHLHHRGQLYAYLRALGQEPPFMWGFEDNEPAFQPKAATA